MNPSTDLQRYVVNPGPRTPVSGLQAAVTTDSAIVTETMLDVLRAGGNAVDAAVAGSLVQAAVEPFMTNHAGTVTFLYYEAATGRIYQLDSLGVFPSGLAPFKPVPASAGSYAAMPPSAVIPGFMPGLKEIHRRFASRSWSDLCAPAVEWAERGHPISTFEYRLNVETEKFITHFPEGREFYQPQGRLQDVGDIFVPKDLGATLRAVAKEGPDHMITGAWSQQFIAKANAMGWKIRPEHMTETPPRWIEPIRYRLREHEIVSLGPPQAQGLYIAVALGVLEHLGAREMKPGSAEYLWAMGHALRQAARHWEYSQDESVYEVPRDELLDDAYHSHLARIIRKSRPRIDLTDHIRLTSDVPASGDIMSSLSASGSKPRLGSSKSDQPTGSCEIAVVDAQGNWVQMMNTLQGSGIPGMVVGGVTMVGSHATFGHLMSSMDATLVPGARGRCVIGNTLVLKDGRPVLSLGSPGNVHCTVPQVLSYVLNCGLDAYSAVDAPRMLPMSEARQITIEDRISPETVRDLHKLGVRVAVTSGYDYHMGSFSVITRDAKTGAYTAIADPRRCAVAGGLKR
ncbi:gamma-glutamyltransferase [Steroidobacter sp.]|uniref:gamma-glutamyltransferase n=1 Tax=Steroidobacter sp. TaxID=1978227 RepID=UPI001A399470|nr:gamma-glutamyltransferase [Steroidobacter sp.]MBL8266373.1 gamma-glutamyltransferase [Steroidobacter sp.]